MTTHRRTRGESEAWRQGAEYILSEAGEDGLTPERVEVLRMAMAMQRDMSTPPVEAVEPFDPQDAHRWPMGRDKVRRLRYSPFTTWAEVLARHAEVGETALADELSGCRGIGWGSAYAIARAITEGPDA